MNLGELVRTIISYILAGIVFIVCIPPCFIIACLPEKWRRDNPIYFWCAHLFYVGITKSMLLSIGYQGLENLPKEPAIIIANHLSALDIPVVGSLLGTYPHIWLFWKKYTKVPFFGFIARRMNVVVDFASKALLMRSLKQAIHLSKNSKRHLVLFPEGMRARNGRIEKFYEGFALIAQTTARPVVPIFLSNLDKAYPPGSFLLHRYPIDVIIGKPFVMEAHESRDAFVARVHAWFMAQSSKK